MRPVSATSTSARSYGSAEAFLGGWLAQRGATSSDVVVGSKWGYTYVGGWDMAAPVQEVKDLSLANFERQYARDACVARRPPSPLPGALADHRVGSDGGRARCSPRWRGAVDEGLLLGITTTGPRQADTIRRALEVRVDGPHALLVGPGHLEPPRAVGRAGAGRGGGSRMGGDRQGGGRQRPAHAAPETPAVIDSAARTGRRQRRGATPDALAIAAALAQPWVSVVLSGAAGVDQLDEQSARSRRCAPSRSRTLPSRRSEYWAARSARPWT